MVVFTSIAGGLCFALIIFISVYIKLVNSRKIELIDWFLLAVALFNGLGFGFVIWAANGGRVDYGWSRWLLLYDIEQVLVYLAMNIILVLSAFYGWHITKVMNAHKKNKEKKIKSYPDQLFKNKIVLVSWVMLIISVVSYWIYSLPYGGFIGLLDYNRAMRSGVFTISNPFSFLQKFGNFSYFSSYIFFGLLLNKNTKVLTNKKSYVIGFLFSLLFSIYLLYSMVGRVGFVVYFGTFFLGYIIYNGKSILGFITKLIIYSFSALFLLIVVDEILGRSKEGIGIIELFANELAFPFTSFIVQLSSYDFRWFVDIIAAPLYLLPMKVWSGFFHLETASSFNTFIIAGAKKGQGGVMGEIPVDMLTFSIMQAPILGVIVVGLLWGAVLFLIERLVNRIRIKGIRSVIYANIVLNLVIMNVLYGDTQHVIVRNFYLIVGFILLWISLKVRLHRKV